MTHSMKECRCGRRIPSDWRVCGVCEQHARLDALDGSAEQRHYRYQALKQAGWPNRDVKPPLGPELLAQLADGISKRAQEASLLGLKAINRQLQDQRIRVRNAVAQAEE
jgi:hypothetical protein